LPDEASPFSENENRWLARFVAPEWKAYMKGFFHDTTNNIASGRFTDAFDEWFADRFVFREELIVLQNELETLRGVTELNGVYSVRQPGAVSDSLLLAWREESADLSTLPQTVATIDAFAENMYEHYGAQSYIMLVPDAFELYKDLLPQGAAPGNQNALINGVYDSLQHVQPINITPRLTENADNYIFYRTDHHWTTYGAYMGYREVGTRMGYAPIDAGWFNIEHATSDFRGTLFSKTLNYHVSPDIIDLYTLSPTAAGARKVRVRVNTGAQIIERDSLFFREHLSDKDKYTVFLGDIVPIIDIHTDAPTDDTLLVFKDSFAHCMIPFLANHYSRITVVDMRKLNAVSQYVDLDAYGQVLFLYSATKFASDESLRYLGLVPW
ncbi:MAG: DHHW family protein, partial [Oscillospiraceae bacterium]|nr:DHHW family protein [Oscillospiraceae bacterium]